MDAFVISSLPSPMVETLQMAGPLRSADITPLHRYYGPSRHPLVFGRLPGFAGYTAYLAPTISRRDEEGFSSCLACPCHRAVASTPPRNDHEAPGTVKMRNIYLITKNQAAIRDLFKVAYDTTGR